MRKRRERAFRHNAITHHNIRSTYILIYALLLLLVIALAVLLHFQFIYLSRIMPNVLLVASSMKMYAALSLVLVLLGIHRSTCRTTTCLQLLLSSTPRKRYDSSWCYQCNKPNIFLLKGVEKVRNDDGVTRIISRTQILSHVLILFMASSTSGNSESSDTNDDINKNKDQYRTITATTNSSISESLYKPFCEYAWDKLRALSDAMQLTEEDAVPSDQKWNSSPSPPPAGVRFPSSNSSAVTTNIHVKGLLFHHHPGTKIVKQTAETPPPSPLNYARSALLETVGPIIQRNTTTTTTTDAILPGMHVLNFVIFPNTNYDIPIFGADIVSLPGNRHLVAIDLQPIRVRTKASSTSSERLTIDSKEGKEGQVQEEEEEEGVLNLSDEHLFRLQALHSKYVEKFPWGGDIPKAANRFFSPYALWTRLMGGGGQQDYIHTLQTDIFQCFQEYLDLYGDILVEAASVPYSSSVAAATTATNNHDNQNNQYYRPTYHTIIKRGHSDYIAYRHTNDPARPLLKRLFGEEWSERLLSEVLFKRNI